MKRTAKNNKSGFTLLEVMLAIAIIMLVSGLFVSLIIATHESYYTTYNYNDSTDYCQMYGKIISDRVLADRQDTGFTTGQHRTYWMNASTCQFEEVGSSTPIVEMPRVHNNDGTLKWIFAVSDISFDSSTNIVDFEITVIDNYHNPGEVLYVYDFSCWIPNMTKWEDPTTPVGERISVAAGTDHPLPLVGGGVIHNYEIVVTKE